MLRVQPEWLRKHEHHLRDLRMDFRRQAAVQLHPAVLVSRYMKSLSSLLLLDVTGVQNSFLVHVLPARIDAQINSCCV